MRPSESESEPSIMRATLRALVQPRRMAAIALVGTDGAVMSQRDDQDAAFPGEREFLLQDAEEQRLRRALAEAERLLTIERAAARPNPGALGPLDWAVCCFVVALFGTWLYSCVWQRS